MSFVMNQAHVLHEIVHFPMVINCQGLCYESFQFFVNKPCVHKKSDTKHYRPCYVTSNKNILYEKVGGISLYGINPIWNLLPQVPIIY